MVIKNIIVHDFIREINILGLVNSFMPLTNIFLYVLSHYIQPPKCVWVTMATGFVPEWCIISLTFCEGFIKFSRGWRVADPTVASLCGSISTFTLSFPMNVYSLCWWGNNEMTSAKRKAFWQLPLRIQRKAPVWESVWHCVRGPTCTNGHTHLCRGRL